MGAFKNPEIVNVIGRRRVGFTDGGILYEVFGYDAAGVLWRYRVEMAYDGMIGERRNFTRVPAESVRLPLVSLV